MFSQESTENLLDNLESELTEMINLEKPKQKSPPKIQEKKNSPVVVKRKTPPPVPARRNIQGSIDDHPVPATRRVPSLDKKEKNDENEIIQLQSMTSDTSESQQENSKQNTVIVLNEKKTTNNIRVVHETEKISDNANETFFVIKHGKWATDEEEKQQSRIVDDEIKIVKEEGEEIVLPVNINNSQKKMSKKKLRQKHESQSSATSTNHTSADTSSTESSTLDESPQPVKRKAKKTKTLKKEKKEEQSVSSCTESENKKNDKRADVESTDKAIGIFINNTGPMKYRKCLKSPKLKISFYNEDNGKQIGDSQFSSCGKLSNDNFYNLLCSWNETITMNFDIKRLREIYNSILIFFELISIENLTICWAFLKLFSSNRVNIDKKCQLQFFQYQKPSNSCFSSMFSKKILNEISIFEQWQLCRRKFPCTLNIFVKDLNFAAIKDEENNENKESTENVQTSNDNIHRYWKKIPGQACKIPNKIYHKIQLDKGSIMVKFSHDGNFIAFTEISKNGHLLHIYKFPEMTKMFTMLEHSDLIHDIDWLKQKTYNFQRLVTASADYTALVWKFDSSCYTYNILPHPSFVYASKFLQNDTTGNLYVVTGGRDNIVRIWKNTNGMNNFILQQELKHPKSNSFTFIVNIATKNAETFYTSTSTGDIVEWIENSNKLYQINRHFKLNEIRGRLINYMELNTRGNKILFRVQDSNNFESANSIFVLGIPTGTITQKYQQINMQRENQGILTISPCGSQIFSTNGSVIRHYQLVNGNVVTAEDNKNIVKVKFLLGDKGFVSAMDYHPKDFYLAISTYAATHNNIIICNYESNEKDPLEQMKMSSQENIFKKSFDSKHTGGFSDIIRRMDEVFLSPLNNENDECQNILKIHDRRSSSNNIEDNTFTIDSKRSRTYTISKGPATFTIQNGTYEIQKNETDEDDTTISESFN